MIECYKTQANLENWKDAGKPKCHICQKLLEKPYREVESWGKWRPICEECNHKGNISMGGRRWKTAKF